MGIIISKSGKASYKRHRLIEKQLREFQIKFLTNKKLLLLGAGDSGKTTIVKQMKILHMGGFTEEEISKQRLMVYQNILNSMAAMIRAMDELAIEFDSLYHKLLAEVVIRADEMWPTQKKIKDTEWPCIKALWKDNGIQTCYHRSNEYPLHDSAKYFLDNIDRIWLPDYQPTDEDILRARSATIGIVEVTFLLRESTLTIIDVGGQRSQRRKWIHCFEGVHALIFIASMSEYNQNLFEDNTKNRMIESLQLFETITASPWFRKTPLILFLNKKDIFEEKIQSFPLSIAFPEYEGDQTYEEASRYVQSRFEQRNGHKKEKFYVHNTCATDTKNVEFVMNACFDIFLSKSLSTIL